MGMINVENCPRNRIGIIIVPVCSYCDEYLSDADSRYNGVDSGNFSVVYTLTAEK